MTPTHSDGPEPRIAADALVEPGATIGAGTWIWDLTHVRSDASVGSHCIVGRGVFVDAGVIIGDRCKIQNNALLYAPAVIGSGVFIGPSVVLTNDRYPRAVTPDGELKSTAHWTPAGVVVGDGASLGAGSTVIGGTHIGRWALVAAGSIVTRDVAAFALVAGSPARRVGWVGPAGHPLTPRDGAWWCPVTGEQFDEVDGRLEPR